MSSFTVRSPLTLYLYVDSKNSKLREKYVEAANAHNQKVEHSQYPDSGFDLYNFFSVLDIFFNSLGSLFKKSKNPSDNIFFLSM